MNFVFLLWYICSFDNVYITLYDNNKMCFYY